MSFPEKESTVASLEPLMVLEQPEMTPSPPAANQAMKGTGGMRCNTGAKQPGVFAVLILR